MIEKFDKNIKLSSHTDFEFTPFSKTKYSPLVNDIGKWIELKARKELGTVSIIPYRIIGIQKNYKDDIIYRASNQFDKFGRPVSQDDIKKFLTENEAESLFNERVKLIHDSPFDWKNFYEREENYVTMKNPANKRNKDIEDDFYILLDNEVRLPISEFIRINTGKDVEPLTEDEIKLVKNLKTGDHTQIGLIKISRPIEYHGLEKNELAKDIKTHGTDDLTKLYINKRSEFILNGSNVTVYEIKENKIGTYKIYFNSNGRPIDKTLVLTKKDIEKLKNEKPLKIGKNTIQLLGEEHSSMMSTGNLPYKVFENPDRVSEIFLGKEVKISSITIDEDDQKYDRLIINKISHNISSKIWIDYFFTYKNSFRKDHFSATDLYNLEQNIPVFKGHYPLVEKFTISR